VADAHRQAFLECIGVDPKQVGAVNGLVIAGRDAGYDPEDLRKQKGCDFGRVKFLTFDDLFGAFASLLEALDKT
jgi:hypothetical protein